MKQPFTGSLIITAFATVSLIFPAAGIAQQSKVQALGKLWQLVDRLPDPHGSPRPARDARDVPLRTSIYFELASKTGGRDGKSLGVVLDTAGDERTELLRPGVQFAPGASGWVRAKDDKSLAVYLETGKQLRPSALYTVRILTNATADGPRENVASWSFTTEAAPSLREIGFELDLKAAPVRWHGRFFSGICNVAFCTRTEEYGPTYELMAEARKQHPRAWGLQRDFWLTGTEYRPPAAFSFGSTLPNIVRERETRRIAGMETEKGAVVLRVEDCFGHEQYGIPSGRPVSADYQAGDEVLIADGVHDARTKVLSADDAQHTVTVAPFATPEGGWKIAYEGRVPEREDPDAPGLFPPGGCYLRKFNPTGTACYYWGRLDKEWDLAVRRYGRRVVPNFADATGDLSRDGRSWTTVKDYAQWHAVARTIAGHIIDRYGRDSLGFTWSIFNEPDLWILFWHGTWDELQTYYDYTTDAILRAFEDRGYDSSRVFIGGLELGAVFGTNLRLKEFLAHCSPRATAPGALSLNAAVADHRLDGKRSHRVESLCRDHGGKGSPCDFVSIHSYNRSEVMAAKLIRAKEMALEIDPEYYNVLWVDSHEACPDWMPPPDEAAADSYLGDGYFPSWCADVVRRQLARASADPRYAYGETILTVWPPPANFAALNAVTRVVHYSDEHRIEQTATVPMPIFHALNLLSDMGDEYWPLPQRQVGGHIISGFASRNDQGVIRVLLYSHDAQDTQSRSSAIFHVTLDINHPGWTGPAQVTQYAIDRDHNSPFRLIKTLPKPPYSLDELERIRKACELKVIAQNEPARVPDGPLKLNVELSENGCNFLVISPSRRN